MESQSEVLENGTLNIVSLGESLVCCVDILVGIDYSLLKTFFFFEGALLKT